MDAHSAHQRKAKRADTRPTIADRLDLIDEAALAKLLGITLGTLRNRQAARSLPPFYRLGAAEVLPAVRGRFVDSPSPR